MELADNITFGGFNAVFLVLVIFILIILALIILALIISRFSKVFNVRKSSKNNADISGNTASVLEIGEDKEYASNLKTAGNDEIIAVLTAAVLAASKSRPDYKLRVKSFRRIPQVSPVWNAAGREEQISGKL